MDKIIIGIHGIGNKPPANILQKWWVDSILEGAKKYNYKIPGINFEMVYWADILHKSPLDPEQGDRKSPDFMLEKYIPEKFSDNKKSGGFRQKAAEYLERYYDKMIISGVLSLENKTITELFIHLHMRDLENYYSQALTERNGETLFVRDAIIDRLAERLYKHRKKSILLIAHSMGSMISHDALIEKVPETEIDTLITFGSPLGQKYVIDNYKKELKLKSVNKLRVPDNIKKAWYNFADLEDQIAINYRLADFYERNSNNLQIIDRLVKNNYTYNGNSNPHKSFGYLRTQEVVQIIHSFTTTKRKRLLEWIKDRFSKLKD